MPETHATATRKSPIAWTWATFFGLGFGRPGPGTYGSVAAVLLWYAAARLFHPTALSFVIGTLACGLFATATGIPASTTVAREAGREDPGFVVIDEVAGQLFTLVPLSPTWRHALLGLILFRLFDIFKPWPIRHLEALPEGLGIMLDDVAAGLLAAVTAAVLLYFIPAWH